MNKKIKIIELLNKIANGEKVPERVKYGNRIYKFYKGEQDYISYDDEETKWCGRTLLFTIMECHHITELLEAEVEILEDNTEEIEEIPQYRIDNCTDYNYCYLAEKYNQLAKAVNKLRKNKNNE